MRQATEQLETLNVGTKLDEREARLLDLESKVESLMAAQAELAALRATKWFRLHHCLKCKYKSPRGIIEIFYLVIGIILPASVKRALGPITTQLRKKRDKLSTPVLPVAENTHSINTRKAYVVQPKYTSPAPRKRVVHALANFMTGGSSRLVIDLLEYLGHEFEQNIITSCIPVPPAYEGVTVTELYTADTIENYLRSARPDILHVHYWGDCDRIWYSSVFRAAERLGIQTIENINTPIHPYASPSITRYVFVSEYVRHAFGFDGTSNMTIYPGSDFDLFTYAETQAVDEEVIGMVYRLEPDKLNEQSLDVFIKVLQRRPAARALIVGGGSLLPHYRQLVEDAGLTGRFEFTGYAPYDKLPELYRRMSLFVAPVWKESFGQVSPFAMSTGIPVVGYDIGALSEILGTSELLAPPADSNCLSDIIINLLDDPARRNAIGKVNHARAQQLFSVEAMIQGYQSLYREILNPVASSTAGQAAHMELKL